MKPGQFILLSASVPYRKEWTERVRPTEIEEAVISLARAVFARGGRLVFGGHPSISPLVASVAAEYFPPDPRRQKRPVVTFQSEFYRGQLPDETWQMHRLGFSGIVWIDKKEGKGPSLTLMREAMLGKAPGDATHLHALTPPAAMIAIGGMEGVLEEAAIFLRERMSWGVRIPPLYLVESGGGASQRMMAGPDEWPTVVFFGDPIAKKDQETLLQARNEGQILSLEKSWRKDHPNVELPDPQFQPYASMTQWLVDSLKD